MRSALLVIAPSGYQDMELAGTRNALLREGFQVTLASTRAGPCTGKFGGVEEALFALSQVDALAYDVLAFIGGPGARALADDPQALLLAKARLQSGKLLGAICIAPIILAAAGVLRGRRATVWNGPAREEEHFLATHGATYTGDPVTVDGQIITANGPDAAEEFGRELAMKGRSGN